ncbi:MULTISPECIES: HAD-IA family hydrolase [Rhodococcus]|uniref:HAD-IA family hydrolase n=1 Tax=Rhodococcus qingshengii JCM 15477 TaxID=1303681 RepID=A0AB38RNV3_RHOSG|nr:MULTISPECIES: HAD-IA family hydrolase [Rhodococcus]MDA3636977.1 HAD-IA family hydrolase [Rhodococcus sp. C-2]UPU46528.1 HAD-IA family hydrolase [Rhodococcus qingshengii JCM 15477]
MDGRALSVVGCRKNSIRSRGEKIWSFEVEEAIREHSATLECASYGFRSNLIEGEVKVSVVAKDGSELSEREPRKFCYTTMAHFQVPRDVELGRELAKTRPARLRKPACRSALQTRTPSSSSSPPSLTHHHLGRRTMTTTKWLTFDCYGTLVDWRSGMTAALRSVAGSDADRLLTEYHRHEPNVQTEHPEWAYRVVLAEGLRRAAERCEIELDEEQLDVLGRTLPTWPMFPDTNEALKALEARGYRLGILSNVDREMLLLTLESFEVGIDEIVTSSDIGSYKPAAPHFETFRARTGTDCTTWIHVACSLFHDVEAADSAGIRSIYINRENTDYPAELVAAVMPDLKRLPEVVEELFGQEPS